MTLRTQTLNVLTRFTAAAGLVAALLITSMSTPSSAAAFPCFPGGPLWPFCPIILGVAGGGSIATEAGSTDLSLMATNIAPSDADGTEPLTVGQVKWWAPDTDGQPVVMESTVIEEYGPMPDNESGRVIRGQMTVDGEGEYPFVVQAIDGEFTDETVDSVTIQVGDAVEGISGTGFSYSAEGPLESGDIQLLTFEPEAEGGTPTS